MCGRESKLRSTEIDNRGGRGGGCCALKFLLSLLRFAVCVCVCETVKRIYILSAKNMLGQTAYHSTSRLLTGTPGLKRRVGKRTGVGKDEIYSSPKT